ncbi:MAG: ribonuclease HII [Rikenellaceae bacterium]|nr:ribonuclease HII [Rikenellaceae bacterium]
MLKAYYDPHLIEAGCDEAGRGCLAGPVFAAAVILPKDFSHPLLNDSKQLTEKQRYRLRRVVEQEALDWKVESVTAAEIDRINILRASFLAMSQAVAALRIRPELLLIDGNRFYSALEIPYRCIVKGDGKFASIAAASVLAKTYRDEYMENLDTHFPHYGWKQNKGYPTLEHRLAMDRHGLTVHHRVSFHKNYNQLSLF